MHVCFFFRKSVCNEKKLLEKNIEKGIMDYQHHLVVFLLNYQITAKLNVEKMRQELIHIITQLECSYNTVLVFFVGFFHKTKPLNKIFLFLHDDGNIFKKSDKTGLRLTLCLDLECRADQRKQGGVKHDCPIAVQRHVHGHQTL